MLEIGAQYDAVSREICYAIEPNGQATLVDVARPAAAKSGRCTHRDKSFVSQQSNVNVIELERLEDWKKEIFNDTSPLFDVILIDLGHLTDWK